MPTPVTKVLKLTTLIIALSQLGACAVMSKKQCLSADWQRVGYSVGADGNRALDTAVQERQKACGKHGVVLDRAAFTQGHNIGIDYFCDPYNAVEHGVKGRYRVIRDQVCPERDYPGFAENFDAGYRQYELNQDVYNAHAHVSRLESKRSDYHRRVRAIKKQVQEPDVTDEQRKSLNKECDSLEYRIREISYSISSYEDTLYDLKDKARRYRRFLDDEFLDPLLAPDSGLPSAQN